MSNWTKVLCTQITVSTEQAAGRVVVVRKDQDQIQAIHLV